jgi:hypothetical protein
LLRARLRGNSYIYFEGLEIVWHYKHMMVLSLRTLLRVVDKFLDIRESGYEFGGLECLDLSGTSTMIKGLVALYQISSLRTLILVRPRKNLDTPTLTVTIDMLMKEEYRSWW